MSDILAADGDVYDRFDKAEAAPENELLPPGWYRCELGDISPDQSAKKGTPSIVLEWRVIDEPHAKRRVWQSLWLTDGAITRTKRDLSKIGITSLDQVEDGVTARIIAEVLVGEQRDDDGAYEPRNQVRRFKVVSVEDLPGVDDDEFPVAEEEAAS